MNLLDFLFPKKCVGCGKVGRYFCSECINNISQSELVCPFCERASVGGLVHPVCRRKFGLDGLWSLGVYQDPLRAAIQRLKYKWIEELALILVDITLDYWAKYNPILVTELKRDGGKNWLVVPVPLHWQRQNWRGFNQASLLGQALAKKIGLKYQESLKRIKKTKPQVGKLSAERRQNIKGAFALSPNSKLTTYNILLIDDVWTTGSTLKECCYILKRGGTKKIWALTLAR